MAITSDDDVHGSTDVISSTPQIHVYNYMSRVPYASAVGSLMYVMVCTRPDIAHAVSVVSRFMNKPGKEHWQAAKCYLKGTSNIAIIYGGDADYLVVGYSVSDYAADVDGKINDWLCLHSG